MDPVQVLPKELLLRLFRTISPEDLVTLGQLNKTWRSLARDPEVWKDVELEPDHCTFRDALRVLRSAPRLKSVELDSEELAEQLLQSDTEVTRLDFNMYEDSPDTMKQVIGKFADHLESLELGGISPDILDFLVETKFPKLHTLALLGTIEDGEEEVSASDYTGRWQDLGPGHSTLQELALLSLDDELAPAVASLITAHRHTLTTLELGYINGEQEEQVLQAVAECSGLTKLNLFWSDGLDLLCGKLPSLRCLELEYIVEDPALFLMRSRQQGVEAIMEMGPQDLNEDQDLLPAGLLARLEELSLELTCVDINQVVNALVRRAPHLGALKTLTVVMSARWSDQVSQAVAAALPHVKLVLDTLDDSDDDSEDDDDDSSVYEDDGDVEIVLL